MAKFGIRTTKKEGKATLYVRVQKSSLKIDWNINTGITVNVKEWLRYYVNGSPSDWNSYTTAGSAGAELKAQIDKVEQTINLLFNEGHIKGNEDKSVLTDALFRLANAEAYKAREDIREREKAEKLRRLHECK